MIFLMVLLEFLCKNQIFWWERFQGRGDSRKIAKKIVKNRKFLEFLAEN